LPYIYYLGKELGNKRVGLAGCLLRRIAYWPNVIARIGCVSRFTQLFVRPVILLLLRGIRPRKN